MKKVQGRKPTKKTDKELWTLIAEKINGGEYIFLSHAKKRQKDRQITDIDVLDILENKGNRRRRRNKSKDSYTKGYQDWNYCVEGNALSGKEKLRIIISFDNQAML